METFKNPEDFEEMTLLQTIRIPKNLLFLTDKLPQANYEKIPMKKNLSFSNNKNITIKNNTYKKNLMIGNPVLSNPNDIDNALDSSSFAFANS